MGHTPCSSPILSRFVINVKLFLKISPKKFPKFVSAHIILDKKLKEGIHPLSSLCLMPFKLILVLQIILVVIRLRSFNLNQPTTICTDVLFTAPDMICFISHIYLNPTFLATVWRFFFWGFGATISVAADMPTHFTVIQHMRNTTCSTYQASRQ